VTTVLTALLLPLLATTGAPAAEPAWRTLQPGVEYAQVEAGDKSAGDARIHVVRIDPARAQLVAVMASAGDRKQRTAAAWCRERKLAVAINLGMYRDDKLTNVGHAHAPGHVNNASWSEKYKSVLAFGPKKPGLPAAAMVDLDTPGAEGGLGAYGTVIQNLRLIRAPGRGVWGKQDRRWSEAAVAADRAGRILFIFSRRPYPMQELNDTLLALPLGIIAAMHVEGGPEASLSIHAGGVDLDLNGSYETGFNENDDEHGQWPIPNLLAVPRR
jgi:Phosphodiester glycosidase